MYKFLLAIIMITTGYYLFFNSPYPNEFEFNGVTFASKQDNNDTLSKDIDLFSYKDKTNHHVLLFMISEDPAIPLAALLKQYMHQFQRQGFVFTQDGSQHLGIKNDEVIYITEAKNINAMIAYVEKGPKPMPGKPSDAISTFNKLAQFTF